MVEVQKKSGQKSDQKSDQKSEGSPNRQHTVHSTQDGLAGHSMNSTTVMMDESMMND